MVFLDRLWPDFRRTDLWDAVESYVHRDRRFGGAVDEHAGEWDAGSAEDPDALPGDAPEAAPQ